MATIHGSGTGRRRDPGSDGARERPAARGSRGVVLVSGGADSACAGRRAGRRARPRERPRASTSTTGCARTPTTDEQACRRLCAALGVELVVERSRRPGPATSRPRRATPATRRPSACAPRAARLDRHRAHAHRPGRDHPLPPRDLARAPGAARPAPRGAAASSARCSASAATRSASSPRAPGCRSATTPPTRSRSSPATASATRCCRCSRSSAPRPRDHRRDPGRAARGGRGARAAGRRRAGARRRRPGGAAIAGRAPSPSCDPALQRLALRALAERAAGRPVALGRARAARDRRASPRSPRAARSSSAAGSRRALEHGHVRFARRRRRGRRRAAALTVPGQLPLRRLGAAGRAAPRARRTRAAPTSARSTPPRSARRSGRAAWRDGDRMRPLGLGGTKTLQDLFTDRKVPRSLRRTLPVVACRRADRLGRGGRGLGGVPARRGDREPAAVLTRALRPSLASRRDGPAGAKELIGEILVAEEDLRARDRRARRGDQPRLRGARPADGRRPQGRRPLPRRPDARS